MQSLRDQASLVPRPRSSLPKLCALVVVALTTVAIAILSPEKLLGWAAMVTLLLTLGHVLHGLCLLPEETLYHANRYRGRSLPSQVIPDCGLGVKSLLTVGLSGLLLYLTESPLPHSDLWKLICLVPVLYALLKSIGVLGPSEVELSDICEGRKMNVAHGLAWSFYLGYLRLVLPHLENSITSFCSSHQDIGLLRSRGSRRLFILIPLNSNISDKLEDGDDRIHFYDNLPNNEIDRAGVRGRVYKHSVYRVLDHNGKCHDCVVEYATPLLTLYSMSQDSTAGFGEAQRRQQVLLFYRTLQDVLERSLECRNRYTLILLNDEHEDDPHFLSKSILRHLHQQDKEEFPLFPEQTRPSPLTAAVSISAQNGHNDGRWCHSDSMSQEPSLMFSLERPRPLREPEETSDCYHRPAH